MPGNWTARHGRCVLLRRRSWTMLSERRLRGLCVWLRRGLAPIKAPIAYLPTFPAMRRLLIPLGGLALAAVVVAGLVSAGGGGDDTVHQVPGPGEDAELALAGAPEPLAALHEQGNEILGGGAAAFRDRLRELRGYPVVVNKWASWCGPCRAEFPFFQRQALERGKEVAFVGVNSADNRGDAERFLEEYPVPYPHYEDPDSEIAAVFRGVQAFPSTAFYDKDGELVYLKQGGYATEGKLAEDIERYLGQ